MKLINSHSSYTAFFRTMAQRHKKIAHGVNGQMHFVRVTLSKHPLLAEEDIKEFFRKVNNQLRFPALVLVAYTAGYNANNQDAKRKEFHGEFLILDKVKKEDFEDLEQKLDETEEIGEEIMGFLDEYYQDFPEQGILQWNEGQTEAIANMNMGNLAGTKFYFTIDVPHQAQLAFNENAFHPE